MTRAVCPECGARQRAGRPGTVVACVGCGNPLVVAAPPSPPPAAAPAPVPAAPRAQRSPWATAGLVVLVLGVAHLAFYLLLTTEAREGMRVLEARHGGGAALEAARAPDDAPRAGTPAYAAWREALQLHEDAGIWRTHRRHCELLRGGLLASFVVLSGVTGWVLLSVLSRRGRAA